MHDDYKQLDCDPATLDPCPVCGSAAGLWQYSTSETAPRELVVMCSHGDRIGPQDGLTNEGCLLYMPPNAFYRETIRDAIRFWGEFARALVALRTAGVGAGYDGVTTHPEFGAAPQRGDWRTWDVSKATDAPDGVAAAPAPCIDVEAMLAACVPGGDICDPQQVADAIRAYFASGVTASDHQSKGAT